MKPLEMEEKEFPITEFTCESGFFIAASIVCARAAARVLSIPSYVELYPMETLPILVSITVYFYPMPKSEVAEKLNIFRGVAITSVVIVHSYLTANYILDSVGVPTPNFLSWFALGKYGVSSFFLLSGFLISQRYDGPQFEMKAYTCRRLARIYPLWILFLAIQLLKAKLGFTSGWVGESSIGDSRWVTSIPICIGMALTFSLWMSSRLWNSVIPGGWSIQSEIANYLLYAFTRKLKNISTIYILISINTLTLLLSHLLSNENCRKYPYFIHIFQAWLRLNAPSSFSFFFIGVIASRYLNIRKDYKNPRKALAKLQIPFYTSFLFIFSFILVPSISGPQWQSTLYVYLSSLASILIAKSMVLSKLFKVIGKYSYFIFFFHIQLLSTLSQFNFFPFGLSESRAVWLVLFLSIGILCFSILFGRFSYIYIERPIIEKVNKIL